MDAFLLNLRPLLRAALNGPHAWVYVLIAAGLLLVTLTIMVAWASKADAMASAALAKRAQALGEGRSGPAVTPPH